MKRLLKKQETCQAEMKEMLFEFLVENVFHFISERDKALWGWKKISFC